MNYPDGAPGPPDTPDEVAIELLDLDARLGLSAFEPEQGQAVASDAVTSGAATSVTGTLPTLRFASAREQRAGTAADPPAPQGDHGAAGGQNERGEPGSTPDAVSFAQGRGGTPWTRTLAGVAALLAIVVSLAVWGQRRPAAALGATGELAVASTPAGARVIIGGKERGRTPLTLVLTAGAYELELRAGDERVVLPVQVKAGTSSAQHVFLHRAPPASAGGRLEVTSDPPKATVVVDGAKRGITPLVVTDLQPGAHDIVVTGTTGQVRQRVEVEADATTTVMVPLPKRGAGQNAGGWLEVRAPLELRIFDEAGRLVGTSAMSRLMLPAGPRTLRLTNEAAGVDVTRQVSIGGGLTATLDVALPPGTLSVNALPWAQVWIDGRDVGETPLGGIELPPGPHEVVFRHPDLGERRQPVTVRSGAHSRLSTDFRR